MQSKIALVATLVVATNAGADVAPAKPISPPAVQAKITAEKPGRPPLARLQLEVRLRNDNSEPLWFILPLTSQPRDGGVDTIDVVALGGKGKVTIGRFGGTGGFQAVLLPGHADVTIHDLPFQNWGERGKKLSIEVVIAKGFTIGGKADKKWFTGNPTSDASADVSEAKSKAVGATVKMPNHKEQPVTITEDRRITVDLAPL